MQAATRSGKFFVSLLQRAVLLRTARPHRHAPEAETAQQVANRPLGERDPVALRDHARQVDPPPPHHAVLRKAGALPHQLSHFPHLFRRQTRPRSRSRSVRKPRHALRVVAVHPIAQGLPVHPARRRSLAPRLAFHHQCQRQHPTRRIGVLRARRRSPQLRRRQFRPSNRNRRHLASVGRACHDA